MIDKTKATSRTSAFSRMLKGFVGTLALLSLQTAWAENRLEAIDVGALPGNQVQIILKMSEPAPNPLSFTIDNPARIALDLPDTSNALDQRSQTIGVGLAKSLMAVEAKGRTRVVLNLVQMAPYEAKVSGNNIIITLKDPSAVAAEAASASTLAQQEASQPAQTAGSTPMAATAKKSATMGPSINNVDFRRGEQGEGRIVVTLSDPSIPVDMRQEAGKVVLDFYSASLPDELARRLDVLDFATPVETVDTFAKGNNVRLVISANGEYDHVAYQTNNVYTVEIKETTKEEQEQRRKEKIGYTGERLSLNFQDIEVRSVLQLIADFTETNIVVSDTVTGNLTLRLQNVPWDQALDIVLKTKGLAMRKNEDVILVAPSEEIAAREKLELEAQKQIEELAPLYTEYVQVNYAKARDVALLLVGDQQGEVKGGNVNTNLMSDRGSVVVDERTNTLLLQDTADKLEKIRDLVTRLDIPVRQVLIESRIVIANDDFAKDLGARFGLGRLETSNTTTSIIGGGLEGDLAQSGVYGSYITNPADSDPPVEALMTDLRVSNPMGAANFLIGRLGREFLRLELSAMQAEGRGEVVSSPRVITSNQKEAIIRQGVEIPYLEAASSGAATVSFKEAVLALKVTPQITPDDRIIMDLDVSKDNVGEVFSGVPSINTRNVQTQVLVDNGETVVLGGIYERTYLDEKDKIPVLGDLPGIGFAFRQTRKVDDKSELLIFVTPKIVKQSLSVD